MVNNASDSNYRFNYADAGTLVELYFPKRAVYQGPLYGALWEGLRPGEVAKHLRANENREAILDLLPEEIAVRFEELIEGAGRICFGYSMYEVDGVFVGEAGRRFEERTQIVKLILRPDFEELRKGLNLEPAKTRELAKRFLRGPLQIDSFLTTEELAPDERQFARRLDTWKAEGFMFVYGYLVHRLTMIEGLAEEEIWITSYSNASVNVVKRPK